MIPKFTLKELCALSFRQLDALEAELQHLLATLHQDDGDVSAIHDMLALIRNARRAKRGRTPSIR